MHSVGTDHDTPVELAVEYTEPGDGVAVGVDAGEPDTVPDVDAVCEAVGVKDPVPDDVSEPVGVPVGDAPVLRLDVGVLDMDGVTDGVAVAVGDGVTVAVGDGVHEGATERPVDAHAAGQGHALGTLVLADGQKDPDGHARHAATVTAPSTGLYVPGAHGVGVVLVQ